MMPEQPCDKYPPVKEAVTLISVHFRPSSDAPTTVTENTFAGKKKVMHISYSYQKNQQRKKYTPREKHSNP